MRHFILATWVILQLSLVGCRGQSAAADPEIGGPFENREFFGIGMPETIAAVDTCAAWHDGGQRLIVTGRILQADERTPAPDVILYYYHTDSSGHYPGGAGLDPRAVRHGKLRGWVKSDAAGNYAIYTIRPGAYPGRNIPAHIHPAVWEPGLAQPYYLDDFVFADDPLLTLQYREAAADRGGSGILHTVREGRVLVARRDIVLGLHIPRYPADR